ncbi:MAG TPA: hypothetical protein VFE40_13840 [Jatrophihabitantaceae bacterium]|nr:hypothetical protein [Jatrophihabitantaceae bacterium]
MDGRRVGQVRDWLRQYWLLAPFVRRQHRWTLHPLKTVRQIVLFAVVCLGLDALGAVALPSWGSMLADAFSLVVAFAVVEIAYRRWWQPADQPVAVGQTLRS